MWENKTLFPVRERGAFKTMVWGLFLLLPGLAVLYYGNMLVRRVSFRMEALGFDRLLFGVTLILFVHGLQILFIVLAWIFISDGISRCFGRFELLVKLSASFAGIWVSCSALPIMSDLLYYSFPINFYICLMLVLLFQTLTVQVENWMDKSAAMALWVYSFQSFELLPTYLSDGQAVLLSGLFRTSQEASIASIAGTLLFMSFMAGAVTSTWLLASYSVRLVQVRRSWAEHMSDAAADDNEGLRQVSMVEVRSLVHDLKNPLAAIKGIALMLNQKAPDGSQPGGDSEKIGIMLNAANYMERMIGEILHEDKLGELQIGPFFDRLGRHVRPFPWGEDVKVAMDEEIRRETVAANEIRLTRALLNVMDNAWRANKMAGASGIELRVRRNSLFLEIEILDNGPGIEPAGGTRGSGWGSTGLGLAFVRQAILAHGGNILLSQRRDAPNGASVLISIPVRTAPDESMFL